MSYKPAIVQHSARSASIWTWRTLGRFKALPSFRGCRWHRTLRKHVQPSHITACATRSRRYTSVTACTRNASDPHLKAAIFVGVPVEAAGAKRAGALPKVKVHTVLLPHGCLVCRHDGLFIFWCVWPLCAGGYEVRGGAADGARAECLRHAGQQVARE
jgi:hypothetical protein